jgi:C-terminal processing protease CtpA/Prc
VEAGSSAHPYRYPSTPVNLTTYPDEGIAYMYVSKFYGSEVEDRLPDVQDFYKQIEGYDHLIIDIRGNTGGFYSFWIDGIVKHFIEEQTVLEYFNAYRTGKYVNHLHSRFLIKEVSKNQVDNLPPEVQSNDFKMYKFWQTIDPTDLIEFKGSISILIDTMVYSAAEGFLHFARKYNFADKIYGIPSGGDGLMVWPLFIVLPNSKLVINSASSLGLDSDGNANEEVRTQPDVFFESSFGKWDELIEFVIDDIT